MALKCKISTNVPHDPEDRNGKNGDMVQMDENG